MQHPDDGTLMALLDGEIASEALPPITAHLDGCPECRDRLAAVRALVAGSDALITTLDQDAPKRAPPATMRPPATATRTALYRNLAWAATVILATGLGYSIRGPLVPPATAPPLAREEAPAAGLLGETAAPAAPAPVPVNAPESAARSPAARVAPSAPSPQGDSAQAKAAGRGDAIQNPAGNRPRAQESLVGPPIGLLPAARAAGQVSNQRLAQTAAPAPMALADRQEVALEAFAPIDFFEAVARMGGTLRLIGGLVPDRLEASSTSVRVIYPLLTGELVLEQRREGDSVLVALRGPVSADSLVILRRRIR